MSSMSATESFIAEAHKFPYLSAERELELTQTIRNGFGKEKEKAVKELTGSHLRLVIKIAKQFKGYRMPAEELIAAGNLGMMKAVEKFDPDLGFRFVTFAQRWIKAEILEHVLRNWSLVKLATKPEHKKLFFNLRKTKASLGAPEDGDLSPAHVKKIAEKLDVPQGDVIMMNRRMAGADMSLNAPLTDGNSGEWLDALRDERENAEDIYAASKEKSLRRQWLRAGLETNNLSARERDILKERHLRDNPLSLKDLSQRYNVSRERIRQIEGSAFQKVGLEVRRSANTETSDIPGSPRSRQQDLHKHYNMPRRRARVLEPA